MPCAAAALAVLAWPLAAQVDSVRATAYFREAAVLCARDGGRLWGISLCGPMAFADAATHTIATNQPAPDAKRPPSIGFANTAIDWGGVRWTTIVWLLVPADSGLRGNLMMHELFHRVQPALNLLLPEQESNDHLDTFDGRYWLQLEWRALARALVLRGEGRKAAMRDALAFRLKRRALFAGSAAREHVLEVNEGIPQYTATVTATGSMTEAIDDAIDQLTRAARNETYVRTFPYALGAAWGLLLDAWSPGWTRRYHASDDLAELAMRAARIQPAPDPDVAAMRYGGGSLREIEERRDAEQKAHIADLRRQFVDGPVLVTPGSHNSSFVTNGMTPIPGAGTVYHTFRATAEWGTLDAASVLMSDDREHLTLPGPVRLSDTTVTGDGWTLKLAPGWIVRPGSRSGDFEVVRAAGAAPAPADRDLRALLR